MAAIAEASNDFALEFFPQRQRPMMRGKRWMPKGAGAREGGASAVGVAEKTEEEESLQVPDEKTPKYHKECCRRLDDDPHRCLQLLFIYLPLFNAKLQMQPTLIHQHTIA